MFYFSFLLCFFLSFLVIQFQLVSLSSLISQGRRPQFLLRWSWVSIVLCAGSRKILLLLLRGSCSLFIVSMFIVWLYLFLLLPVWLSTIQFLLHPWPHPPHLPRAPILLHPPLVGPAFSCSKTSSFVVSTTRIHGWRNRWFWIRRMFLISCSLLMQYSPQVLFLSRWFLSNFSSYTLCSLCGFPSLLVGSQIHMQKVILILGWLKSFTSWKDVARWSWTTQWISDLVRSRFR